MKKEKLLLKLLSKKSDKNFDFDDLRKILINFDFEERIKGSHHVFSKKGYSGLVNLQRIESRNAKSYQVKQVRDFLIENKIITDGNQESEI